MARLVDRLSDAKIRQLKQPGRYADGCGLYLQVTRSPDGSRVNRSWLARVRVAKLTDAGDLTRSVREMGLGTYPTVSLADARLRLDQARKIAEQGQDPVAAAKSAIAEKLRADQEAAQIYARAMSFRQCAEAYIAAHKASWRNEKHIQQWTSTLTTYAYPVFGEVAVGAVDVAMVTKVLDPIWTTKGETARRLRGRIESILDWATVRGHRTGDNPARWKGHLQKALPPRPKKTDDRHHAALHYERIAEFFETLARLDAPAAKALQFAILTAGRTGEVIGATWSEVDIEKRVWTVPAARMKGGREHRVPLSSRALEMLSELKATYGASGPLPGDFLFCIEKKRPLSNMAMLMLLRRLKRADLTVHGFRSTFRDWAAERTGVANEVAEAALAHAISNQVEAAYRRGDLFGKRERLMQSWAEYCYGETAKVVPLNVASAD